MKGGSLWHATRACTNKRDNLGNSGIIFGTNLVEIDLIIAEVLLLSKMWH